MKVYWSRSARVSSGLILLVSLGCGSSKGPSIQQSRGQMFGQLMSTFRAEAFRPKADNKGVLSRSALTDLLNRCWFQGYGISPDDGLPETVNGKSVVAVTEWLNRYESDFLNGYLAGWDSANERNFEKMGYAAGWLHADQDYTKGHVQRIGLMGLDLVTETAVVAQGLAVQSSVPSKGQITVASKRVFLEQYDLGYKARLNQSAPRGNWLRLETGLPLK